MKPNFIMGGSSAAGTSFLSAAIVQHPQIYMPKKMRPEPHYFYKSWEYEKPETYYEETYFSQVSDEIAIGERSSSYMFGAEVAKRIYEYNPDMKFIFMLRNPIERAYANYRYTALQGLEDCSFDDALKFENERVKAQDGIWKEIQPYNYTGRGFYFQQIKSFYEYFKPGQFLLLKSEAVSKNPAKYFADTFDFLGVDNNFNPVIPPSFTSLSVIDAAKQKEFRAYFDSRFDTVIETIRKEEPTDALIKSDADAVMIENLSDNMQSSKVSMSEWARSHLRKTYREEFENLEGMLPFDISDWN